jgi:ABC-type glycerol-3-phosphate transport system substrate-binding protein
MNLEDALATLLANNIINASEDWLDVVDTGTVDTESMEIFILNVAQYIEDNPALAELLMRWNGTELIPVARVNRVVIENMVTTGGLLNQPTMGVPKIPTSAVPAINTTKGLKVNYSYEFLE